MNKGKRLHMYFPRKLGSIIAILGFFISVGIQAQVHVKGQVRSAVDEQPLPYVNIGVLGKSMGTVSDEDGMFELVLYRENEADSIRISMIGYQHQTYLVRDFIQGLNHKGTLYMEERFEELSEVVVTPEKRKIKVLGNTSKSKKNLVEAPSEELGSEIGIKIKIKRAPTIIKRFNTKVLTKEYASFKFRLNFYDIKDGMPHNNLLNENIIISSKDIHYGILDIDLAPYDIVVEDDFFVTLEWIEGDKGKLLRFPASILGGKLVLRKVSQSSWEAAPIGSLGFNVTVEY
ncbi:MAG: carboxypeptidase-like regulatory domain-containing protein [Flavobacteriaceae bacterium]